MEIWVVEISSVFYCFFANRIIKITCQGIIIIIKKWWTDDMLNEQCNGNFGEILCTHFLQLLFVWFHFTENHWTLYRLCVAHLCNIRFDMQEGLSNNNLKYKFLWSIWRWWGSVIMSDWAVCWEYIRHDSRNILCYCEFTFLQLINIKTHSFLFNKWLKRALDPRFLKRPFSIYSSYLNITILVFMS